MKTVSRQELTSKLLLRMPLTLVEALPEMYFDKGHLPGAVNINHDQVAAKAAQALPDKDSEIVVYCASATCRNSDIAANQLSAMGYRNVAVYKEGKADWQAAGLPLEGGVS
jgi:rhodanese-related sulfurtransferase